MKLCIFVGVNLGGYVGWELCERFGLMIAFLASSAGSILGVVLGWKIARHYLS
jgi:chromate transport protein ChrA